MENETKQAKKQVYEICWFMRGGITSNEAWMLSYEDRTVITKIIDKNIENTTKAGITLL